MTRTYQQDYAEPFFITEEAEDVMIAAGYEFEPPPIVCIVRQHDVLERMGGPELAWVPGEIADQERERRQNKQLSVE